MPIATLSIDIEARLARLEQGLDNAARINAKAANHVERRWQAAGSAVKTALAPIAAAFSVGAITQFVLANARAVDSLNDVADATGATVENISALQDVARRTGTDVATVETALIKMNQALAGAKVGSDADKALKAIGLSAKELKAEDPAEALRKIAVALSGYADDGNKARLVQELFGKSLKEVAPLLKDLATQSQLVATVTKEQADQAERFVHALGRFDAAATNARQALTVTLLPSLTEFIERINLANVSFGGFMASLSERFAASNRNNKLFGNETEAIKEYRAEIEQLQGTLARINSGEERRFALLTGEDRVPILEKKIAELKRAEAFFTKLSVTKAPTAQSQVDASLLDTRGGGLPFRSVGDPFGDKDKKDKKGIAADLDFRRSEIAGTEKVNLDLRLAQLDDFLKDRKIRLDAQALQDKQVLENIDKQREEEDERDRIAADRATKRVEEMSEFAKQAQRDIQQALGSTLKATLKADFDDIGEMWLNLLLDMATNAAAANLNTWLFGNDKSNPFGGGVLGVALKGLIPGFATGTDFVPRDTLAMVHRGEAIVPAHLNGRGSMAPQIIVQQTNHIGDGVTVGAVVQAMQVAEQRAVAAVSDAMSRGSPRF